jgi:hypothetical protein
MRHTRPASSATGCGLRELYRAHCDHDYTVFRTCCMCKHLTKEHTVSPAQPACVRQPLSHFRASRRDLPVPPRSHDIDYRVLPCILHWPNPSPASTNNTCSHAARLRSIRPASITPSLLARGAGVSGPGRSVPQALDSTELLQTACAFRET